MQQSDVQYHYHYDPLFEKMHTRLAWRMMEMDDLDSIEAGIYSYDLVVRWYDVLSEQPRQPDGVPITIDMLPLGVFAHEIVEETFPELSFVKRAAIAQAWFELRDAMFAHFVDLYTNVEQEICDADLIFSLGQYMHLVPNDGLDDNPRVSLRLFFDKTSALNYGRD